MRQGLCFAVIVRWCFLIERRIPRCLEWLVVAAVPKLSQNSAGRTHGPGPRAEGDHPRPGSVATDTSKQIPVSGFGQPQGTNGCIVGSRFLRPRSFSRPFAFHPVAKGKNRPSQVIELGVDETIFKVIEGRLRALRELPRSPELPCSLAVQAKWDGCDESTLHRKLSRRDTPRKS